MTQIFDPRWLRAAILFPAGMLLAVSGVSLLVRLFFADEFITAAFRGSSLSMVDRYVAIHRQLDPDIRTLEYFISHGQDVILRLAVIAGSLGGLFLAFRISIAEGLSRFLSVTEMPQVLAMFRIVTGGAVLIWVVQTPLAPFAAVPDTFVVPPPGWGWISPLFPWSVEVLHFLQFVTMSAAFMAMVGWHSRLALVCLTSCAFLLMGYPQFFGKIDHYHHLIWFSALLAASPAGDVWSIDAYKEEKRMGTRPKGPSLEYGFPVRVAMLMIGLIYFFPGMWKVIIGGWEWPGETMQTQLHAKWMSLNWTPFLRIDMYPILLKIAGFAVLVFEWCFIFVLFSDRWRSWLAFGGILFHIGIYMFMQINFWTLAVCYVIFCDGKVLRSMGILSSAEKLPAGTTVGPGSGYTSAVLLGMAILTGVTLLDSWPFAVYPTFGGVPQPNAFVLTVATDDGREIRPLMRREFRETYGASRAEGFVHQVVWSQDARTGRRKAGELLSAVRHTLPDDAMQGTVRVYRDLVSVSPGSWGTAPVRREKILDGLLDHVGATKQ